MRYATWIIVAFVTLLRGFAAWKVPLTGDEAYYWEWAKHLALGYADRPPMVAYLIFRSTGRPRPVLVAPRLSAVRRRRDARRGRPPRTHHRRRARRSGDGAGDDADADALRGLVLATPDGPLMAGLGICIYVVRASQTNRAARLRPARPRGAVALLSKMFAWALVAGIVAWSFAPQRRRLWRAGLGISVAVAAVLYVPFVMWNASARGSLYVRVPAAARAEPSAGPAVHVSAGERRRVFPGLVDRGAAVLVRPRNALIAWTAIPLSVLLIVAQLSRADRAALDLRPVRLAVRWGWASRSTSSRIVRASCRHGRRRSRRGADPVPVRGRRFPGPLYAQFPRPARTLRNGGPFEIFTYWPLAQDVRRMAAANDAVVVTDGYGFSSQMDFEAGIPPVVIGYARKARRRATGTTRRCGRSAFCSSTRKRWCRSGPPEDISRARPVFPSPSPMACGHVEAGPTSRPLHRIRPGTPCPTRTYFLTWCESRAERAADPAMGRRAPLRA